MKKSKYRAICAGCLMVLLILSGTKAAKAAAEGLEICIRTVIPSLFPFFVLSVLITGSAGDWPVLRPVGKLFRLVPGAESILITGLLGGYPVGAKAAAEAVRQGRLSKKEAGRMLGFCSQPGPAFLFGVVSSLFSRRGQVWALWGIQLFSAWIVSRAAPAPSEEKAAAAPDQNISLPQALRSALGIMAEVCGWVVLFRMGIRLMLETPLLHSFPLAGILLSGIMELTNGCLLLQSVQSEDLRFVLCSIFLSFGGLCVLMQTCSAVRELDIRVYIRGKMLQTVFASILSVAYLWTGAAMVMVPVLLGFFLGFWKKGLEIPRGLLYNLE